MESFKMYWCRCRRYVDFPACGNGTTGIPSRQSCDNTAVWDCFTRFCHTSCDRVLQPNKAVHCFCDQSLSCCI